MQSRRTGLSISRMRSAVNMTAPLMSEMIVNSPSWYTALSSAAIDFTRCLICSSVSRTSARSGCRALLGFETAIKRASQTKQGAGGKRVGDNACAPRGEAVERRARNDIDPHPAAHETIWPGDGAAAPRPDDRAGRAVFFAGAERL